MCVRPGRTAAAVASAGDDHRSRQSGGSLEGAPRIPPFIAVPTTAGTGSETTIAAVVTGADHHKYAMNARLGIPAGFTCIREADLPQMAAWAAKEANPTYPVPVIYDRARFIRVIRQVMQ